MAKALGWIFVLLPCAPGLTLLLAGVVLRTVGREERDAWRVEQLFTAGGAVLLMGLVIGAFVAWRIVHPRPEPGEDEEPSPPPRG